MLRVLRRQGVAKHISEGYICRCLTRRLRCLLDYDRRRYWLANGWSLRFRIAAVAASTARPQGVAFEFAAEEVGLKMEDEDDADVAG